MDDESLHVVCPICSDQMRIVVNEVNEFICGTPDIVSIIPCPICNPRPEPRIPYAYLVGRE